jgi:hypothetical protein
MDEQQPRPPVFELHIRPMMRLLDREHMRTLVHEPTDLWDLDTVWSLRTEILTRVRDTRDMPGIRYGGPWPDEWISLFERWAATGTDTQPGHHLLVATPVGDYRVQSLGGGKRRLIVTVTAPSPGCQAWFELDEMRPSELEYTLWLEPPYPEQAPNAQPLQTLETFVQGTATQLVINDLADGQPRRNEIPLT